MTDLTGKTVRRFQVLAVSIIGAVAIICFVLSLLLSSGTAEVLRTIAIVAAVICALIGVSFAFSGGRR